MESYRHFYISVSCDLQPQGFNLACWMSPANVFLEDSKMYSYYYEGEEGNIRWHIHSNCELTVKAVSMIVEYANRLVEEANRINAKRKLANR